MTDNQGYASPYQPAAETSSLAVISLAAGILSFLVLPLVAAIAAVITGHMAKSQIRNSMGRLTGDGLATAGLVLGYINLGLALCGLCGLIFFLANTRSGQGSFGLLPGLMTLIG